MERFPSTKSFACISTWSRIALAMALVTIFAINGSALADTFWSDSAPTSVSDLMNGDYWTNGAPTSADNLGYITGKTLAVTSDFKPGADGQNVDLTFGQGSDVTMNNAFVPLANLASGQKGTVTFRLTDNAKVYVGGNFWGGNNTYNKEYSLNPGEYLLYQYYGGNSTFSSNEWWSAMSVKTYMEISGNAKVTARGGNSGMGWDDKTPYASYGSKLELKDNGTLTVKSTNFNVWGTDTTVNMFDKSTMTANTVVFSHDTPKVNLYDNSQFSISHTLMVDNKAAVSVSGNAKLTVSNDCAFDRNGSMTVSDNAVVNFNRQVKIGDSNNGEAGGAVFTQTGGKVTTSSTTFFSFHSDATVNLSGGQFICNNSELYVTDKRDCKADIYMTDNGYLQCNDLRLSQHGHVNLTMSGNSQIKANTINAAYNYDPGDNVVNVNILNGSANITANNMNFFGRNTNGGAAYGSLTLNGNSTVVIANETKVGLGVATDLIEGKSYAAEITLNGNSKFSTKTFTTNATAKSATTVNGSAIFEAETINLAANTFLNVNGGSVNVTSLNNEGTVNLAGGAITLTPYGLITSTAGTFSATSGAVNITVPSGVSYSAGDQMIVGYFANDATATAVSGKTVVPENWQVSVISMGDTKKAVVASYGNSAPTGVKIWTGGAGEGDTTMGNAANWEGDASNPTGYVLDGTNTISGITGKTAILGGTNTLSGSLPSGAVISINGGTTTYNSASINGSLLVNEGTFTSSSGNFNLGDNVNGAVFNQTGGKVTVNGTTYFSFHASADINLSGGEFISNSAQLYVTDNNTSTANINMSGDSYLQAKDMRLSQHGKTNLTMSDNAHLSVTTFNLAYNYSNGDNVESIVTMSGNSRLDDSGSFLTFQGNNDQNHSGAAYASFTMSDNAYAYISGNTWGGSNDGGNVPALLGDNPYNLEMTFKDNSYFSTGEFWMAMAGVVHITIQDNATVIARSGNSGLGWCEKTTGSLLEITGGTLQVDSDAFHIGHDSSNPETGYANVYQTDGTATFKVLNIRHANSGYYISVDNNKPNANPVMTSGSISTVAGSTLSIATGTLNAGTITSNGTIDLTGGTFNMGTGGISGEGTVNLAGGTVTSGAEALPQDKRGSWTSSVNATLTGTGDSRVTFAPAADTSITWSGVISGEGGLIVNGDGTFALATPSTYTGLTSIEKGTFEIAFAEPTTAVTIASFEMADNAAINVASGTVIFGGDSVTLKNLTGGSLNNDGTIAVSSTVSTDGTLTLYNDETSKYIGFINAGTIEKTGEGTLQVYAAANGGGVHAEKFIVSSGRLDLKDYYKGKLEVKPGATLSPGNSVGTLTVDGEVILNNAAKLLIEQDETGVDQLIAKSYNINENAVLELDFESAHLGQTYVILLQKDGDTAVDFTDQYQTDEFWNSILSSENAYYWNLFVEGNAVMAYLDPNAVPEPSTWALLILGAAGLLYWRKRK
ncbi:MAG: PEP-CTERM sorting domain-containing protein [Thermoguttaceae bacterium]|nr:PEP-CTERM sorting domain-containing protein [Thermoguttaceae bacterium]